MTNATQRAERTAFVLSLFMYPVVWFLACYASLQNVNSATLTWQTAGFAVVDSLSYLAGQIAGAWWTGKIFLSADPVALPIALVTFGGLGTLLFRAEAIARADFVAIGMGVSLGFILGHPIVLIVAATADTLLKRIISDGRISGD